MKGLSSRIGAILITTAAWGCTGTSTLPDEPPPDTPGPGPGEICNPNQAEHVKARFEPAYLVLAPGQKRTAQIVVDPDLCDRVDLEVASSDPELLAAPTGLYLEYGKPTADVEIVGDRVGSASLTVEVPTGDADVVASATLEVDVLEPTLSPCDSSDDVATTLLEAGNTIAAAGSMAGASISLPATADRPNDNAFRWSVPAFDTSIHCAEDIVPAGHTALGPAITFGPESTSFPRDLPISIPLNPARLPETATLRHVRIAYSGPKFRAPRTFPATDPRLVKVDDGWRLAFLAPRLGTFQAVVHNGAGETPRARRLTHRAVLGVSMGGAGAQMFGFRHHQLFDVVAALGGPVSWTWLVDHLEHNHLGGFRPIAPGTTLADIPLTRADCSDQSACQSDESCINGKCTLMAAADEPYEHPSTYLSWWYEVPGQGHGGSFDREEYVQLFRDISLMFGNLVGHNPLAPHLPSGADPTHPAYAGESGDCLYYVKPIDGDPNEAEQQDKFSRCPVERCQHTLVLDNYYDDEFNPDGTFPVISFCDGSPQNDAFTPWANTWTPDGNNFPVEVGLAVDYNANGVRDELEPVIKSGHERWDDWGVDGLPSALEPGYGPDNLDPHGDDYDPRFNPGGLEGDRRWQPGEPFDDHGLDGVDGTSASPYDMGEDDGQFTVAPGLQRFWDVDAQSMLRGMADHMLTRPLDDAALSRIDVWTDGGIRDLFNFAVAAEHFVAPFSERGRHAAYFRDVTNISGLDPSLPDNFNPAHIVWRDVQGIVNFRYGKDEPDDHDIQTGAGQHAGTIPELAKRLQSALYFIDSRWADAPRTLVEPSIENPLNGDETACEVQGNCNFEFTSSDGRTGPVGVTLPPGYAHADLQHYRFPVVYVLHGYGMTPEDLQLAIVFLANWMNGELDSQASRLGKAILVYVDGRCREQTVDGERQAECIRGTFFTDSPRPGGPQLDNWFLELIDEIDRRYRTLGDTTVEWTE